MDHALERRLAGLERRMRAVETVLEATRPAPEALPRAWVAPIRPAEDPTGSGTEATRPTGDDSATVPSSAATPPPLPETRAEPVASRRQTAHARSARAPASKVTTPAPKATTPAPSPTVDWERFFGLAVLGRIGVGAVLLAAGYFAQLAYKGMPDVGKVVSIYGLAVLFFGVGYFVREKVSRHYVALLWGGATASAYLAAVAAHLKYALVGDTLALVLLVVASAIGQLLARALRHQTLASMALAGAFAAPLIADASLAESIFVLIYLLTLHTWSAWIERVWAWTSARVVGIAGTVIVGTLWLAQNGATDTQTYLLIHLYVLGLMAPELVAALRREPIATERQFGIAFCLVLLEGVLLLSTLVPGLANGTIPLPAMAVLAGLAWTGIALVLSTREASDERGGALMRGLAHAGGLLLAIGVVVVTDGLPPKFPFEPETVAVWGTVLVALGALALRGRLQVGELAASVAVALACVTALLPSSLGHAFALFPVAAAGAAALLHHARHGAAKATAAWGGLLTVGMGLTTGVQFAPADTYWIAIALVAASGWAAALGAYGRWRGLRWLEGHAMVQIWLIAAFWAGNAFGGLSTTDHFLIFDPMSVAGLVLAVVAGHTLWLHQQCSEEEDSFFLSLALVALALPILVGHREVSSAVADLATSARAGWHTLYFAAAAVVAAWIGRRDKPMVGAAALVIAGITLLTTIYGVGLPGASPWAAAQVAAALVATWTVAMLGSRRHTGQAFCALILFGGASACWTLYAAAGRFPHDVAILNLRFLVGLLALAGAWSYPYERLHADVRRASVSFAKISAVVLGFLVGHAEVWALVKDLEGAWPKVLVSVYMVLYAAALLTAGFLRRDTHLRYPALGLFGIVVLKVGFVDLASAETGLRIFVTGILGLVLLASAFAYARRSRADGPDGALPSGEEAAAADPG